MNEHLSNSCSSRLEWIDLLKGIAIFCVVLGHMSYTAETEHVKNLIVSLSKVIVQHTQLYVIVYAVFLALLLFGKVISTNRFQNNVASHIN